MINLLLPITYFLILDKKLNCKQGTLDYELLYKVIESANTNTPFFIGTYSQFYFYVRPNKKKKLRKLLFCRWKINYQ